MKKYTLLAAVLLLIAAMFVGCGKRRPEETVRPTDEIATMPSLLPETEPMTMPTSIPDTSSIPESTGETTIPDATTGGATTSEPMGGNANNAK